MLADSRLGDLKLNTPFLKFKAALFHGLHLQSYAMGLFGPVASASFITTNLTANCASMKSKLVSDLCIC
jgi:hypothetical protein